MTSEDKCTASGDSLCGGQLPCMFPFFKVEDCRSNIKCENGKFAKGNVKCKFDWLNTLIYCGGALVALILFFFIGRLTVSRAPQVQG